MVGSSTTSTASLLAEIKTLEAELASLQARANQSSGYSTHYIFTRNLGYLMTGSDVNALQRFLISNASGPAAAKLFARGATQTFGILTYNALVEFQKKVGIHATGYFGPITRAYVNGIVE